jgi:hypothetical protein
MSLRYFSAARISMLAVCWLACPSAFAADVWRAYTSENFTLYSDGSEAETKRILESFELFRDSALAVLGLTAPRHQRALEISARSLAPDEGLLLLASVAAETSRYETAHEYFAEADEFDGEYRTNLMARRAIAYIHEEKTSEGDELMRQVTRLVATTAR